jgi:hypothetical protein
MEEESTGGRGFRWDAQAHGRGTHRKNGIRSGIASSWTLIQTGKIKMRKISPEQKQFQMLFTTNANFIKNLNTKTSIN